MVIHTEGEPGAPAVLLLHPPLFSGETIAALLGRRLTGSFFLIFPDLGGHGADGGDYLSGKQEEELHRFLTGQGIGEARLLFASSLGAVTGMELMKREDLRFRSVHLDSVPLGKQGSVQAQLVTAAFFQLQKKAQKEPASVEGRLSGLFGRELGKSMTERLCVLSQNSARRILKDCLSGCDAPPDEQRIGCLTFDWGEKDICLGKGKPLAEKLYPRAKLLIRPGMNHCEYLGRRSAAYTKELMHELEE